MCTATVKQYKKNKKTDKIFYGMACNSIKHLYLLLRLYLDKLIDFVFSIFWEERKALPNLEPRHAILKESAVELAKRIRNKELKSEELVKACVERIKAVNPVLNAMTDERFEAALQEARQIDAQIAEGLPDDYFEKRPFLGVPFTAKESHAVHGMRHTLGIAARAHVRAHADAECVRLMRAAGAIPLAVTNVPEINKWQEARNMLFGQTVNPYHTGRTPGGSSGGEAALMAALATPIALCSDIGGSTRMPAFYCGLFGHNPTAGCTSLKGSALRSGEHDTMASIGFVARHSCDLAPLTAVVAADKAPDLKMNRDVDIKDVKFFYVETGTDLRVSPICGDLRKAMSNVVKRLSSEATSTEGAPQTYTHVGFAHAYALWKHHMSKEHDSFPALLANNQGEACGLVELPKKLLGLSPYTLAGILKLLDEQVLPLPNPVWAEDLTNTMREDLTTLLGDNGVLLFPSAPHPAPYHYSAFLRPFNFAYWGLFNALRFPSTQVPLGLNAEGLPLGIQVVAAPYKDALCLAVARHLEELFGGYVPPCQVLQ